MNEKALFAERLKKALLDAGYEARPVVLEREFNLRYWGRPISFQAVRRWLRGESLPEQDKLLVLAEWLEVDPQELRFGRPAQAAMREPGARWTLHAQGEEEVLRAYLELPIEQRKVLREVIMAFVKANKLR